MLASMVKHQCTILGGILAPRAHYALGSDFHWKNVHFREVGQVLSWQT